MMLACYLHLVTKFYVNDTYPCVECDRCVLYIMLYRNLYTHVGQFVCIRRPVCIYVHNQRVQHER